ncbi:mating-type alpha-pheromone receptor PreB [Aspergillus heteromorphus CBS 117.55]|uniref:Mating-type alpha-pheromone receptor PreB n=1 Tax=Aspergillus heteromorphus CBS 117.55 TaxID=1448321 RepID=A0A317WQC0_9EURO|nr:mating-type alpha-pheromone receptor PreB [Aspergillus heteromorphus CBS 117.55]PWY87482.1 mating-type alpha-pheromone receptor PreB [Aspergillus heteromorphus CBS 117.55]
MASDFDPYTQNVTFHSVAGNLFEVNVQDIDMYMQYGIRICINYGAQLGASIILFVILLLLTRPEKRRSCVFILNCCALLFNVGQLVCQVLYFTSPFMRVYSYFAGDFSQVPLSAYINSVTATVFTTLLMISIETSLVLQVQVVCANFRRRYRHILLTISLAIATIPVGFRMALMVENDILIMGAQPSLSTMALQSNENITVTTSICFFCAIFIAKLGYAIRQRRKLGVRDFGPMKVIFIMGCQTLVIPAFLSILQYILVVPALSSNVITIVTISLPLSSIWAGVTLDNPHDRSGSASSPRRNLWNMLSFSNFLDTRQTSSTTHSMKPAVSCYADRTQPKLERDNNAYGISVEHDISVHSVRQEKDIV